MDKAQLLQRVIEYLDEYIVEDLSLPLDPEDCNHVLRGFFDELAPEDIEAFYEGVEYGDQIAQRINAAKRVCESGGSTSPDHPQPVDEARATAMVKQFIQTMHTLAEETNREDLVEMLDISEFAPRTGDHVFQANERSSDILFRIGTMGSDIVFNRSEVTASMMYEAVYTLFHQGMIANYIQWPICAELIRTPDPFEPFFRMWSHGVNVQFNDKPGIVDFYYPTR